MQIYKKIWVLALLVFLAYAIKGLQDNLAPLTSKELQQEVFLEVLPNEGSFAIGKELYKKGVIRNPRLFYWYGRLTGNAKKIKAGDYKVTSAQSLTDIFNILTSGISYGEPLTIPEGYTFTQIADLLPRPEADKKHFLELCRNQELLATFGIAKSAHSIEGYLYPETYSITRRMPVVEMLKIMVKKNNEVFNDEFKKRAQDIGLTVHQVLTLASIIEKETGAAVERPIISSVFHNRLKKKMKLQTDPTVIYGIKNYTGNLTKKDLETYTPYNTYRIEGLPPGPIGNPGKDAIRAALYPETTNYLYFVSHNDGTHAFSETYEKHLAAVKQFQIDAKAREGKSWRNLPKEKRANSHSK